MTVFINWSCPYLRGLYFATCNSDVLVDWKLNPDPLSTYSFIRSLK